MGFAERWRSLVDKVLRRLDRYTHTHDRRRARLRTLRRKCPRRILIVCYGNICRSPYAEASLRRRLASEGRSEVMVDSSGFYGPDRPANELGARIALERGIDLSSHRSKLFGSNAWTAADLILVMTREHQRRLVKELRVAPELVELLGDFDVADPPEREISDPYAQPDDEFRRVFDQIDRSLEGFCLQTMPRGA